jgi:ABC-type antimicrobial peptide transport system permease subunit
MKSLLKVSSLLAIGVGIVLVIGGIWAIGFTYRNVARENIVTPADASIPNTPVRGPLTLKAQADTMRKHALERSGGLTYAEMTRDNENRDIWITVTALTTALHLAVLTYLFSGLIVLFGAISIWTGLIFQHLAGKQR